MAFQTRFLPTETGNRPVEEFLDELGPKDAQKVAWVLRLIERLDRVPKTYLEKLPGTEEIWAVRIQGTRVIYRILGFIHRDALWLTNGYVKKTRRTDAQEIARAERMRRDFLGRQED
jgi:phage-related protein